MRKKITMLLASLFACVGVMQAQDAVYQKISHAKWTVTSFNQTPTQPNGREGGVDFIKDEDANTFYHSNWSGTNEGKEGKQGFLIQMAESYTIDKITYEGRSDNNSSGWARGVRIYVYEELPTDFPKDLSSCKGEEKETFLVNETVLGTPAFDNTKNLWADDRTTKTAEFATPQTGKYIFFVMDSGTDNWLTCSEFHAWQKIEGIEQDKPYYLKLKDVDGAYLDVKTGLKSDYGNTISKTTEGVCAYFILENGYWHISSEAGHKGNFVGVTNWDAKPGQASPANWTLHKDDTYDCWYLAQHSYFGSNDAAKHYLGANNGDVEGESKLYTDKTIGQAAKIVFEAVPYAEVTFNYYDGETKFASANVIFDVNEAISIEDVPAVDFYTNGSFKTAGDIVAVNGAGIDVACTPAFPFVCATVDTEGNIEGPWYKMNNGNNKIALADAEGRVNFVSDNNNDSGLWAFVKVGGYKFRIYNRACPGVPMTVVETSGYQNYNQSKLYVHSDVEGLTTDFIISKNVDGFNIQIPGELINNWYATAGNHISGTFGFWSKADANPITADGSRLSVEEVSNLDFVEVSYSFTYGGKEKYKQVATAAIGDVWPAINYGLFPYGVAAINEPEGVIDNSDVEGGKVAKTIELKIEKELPFVVAADVNSIDTWYYIQMHTNQPGYIGDIAEDKTINVAWNKETDGSDTYVWGFAGNVFDGIIIVNKGTKLQLTSTGDGNVTLTEAGTAFFVAATTETSENATYGFCLRKKDANKYVNANYSAAKLSHWNSTDAGSTFFATECDKEYAVEVSPVGYSTYYSLFRLTIPETVSAYVVAETKDGSAVLEQVIGVLPARTGVILKGEGTHKFVTTDATVATITSNKLQGSIVAKEVTVADNKVAYILANKNGVGLYKVTLTDGKFTNGANKAYMVLDKPVEGAAPAMFVFSRGGEDEDTTGIDQLINNGEVVIYDLSGRRVEKMEKGIYIVNGKKVVK